MEKMEAGHWPEAAGERERPVLQVALAPAAIAFQVLDHGRRRLFVAAAEIVGEVHFVAGAAHQRGLDEIVTHRPAADRAPPRQLREGAVLHERRDPDDRVVAPEVAFFAAARNSRPRRRSARRATSRTAAAGSRSVRPLIACGTVWRMPMRWLRSIRLTRVTSRRRAHQAVGVEADHVAILAAPAPAEIGDVSALAVERQLATTVEDSAALAVSATKRAQPASSAAAFTGSVESLRMKN